MAIRHFLYISACASMWAVILPVLLIGGLALFAFALLTELGELLVHGEPDSVNSSGARELAMLICSRI
jgi:hypothetical protein